MKFSVVSCVGLALAAGAADAAITTFSFASDNDHTSWTFRGAGGSITDAQDTTDLITLTVDDGNGPLPSLTFNVEFQANLSISHVTSTPSGGGLLHVYNLNGGTPSFGFFLPGGVPLLTATITGGAMTSLGTAGAWGSGGDLEATDIAGQVTYTWHGANLPGYGLFTGQSSIGIDDAAFTLSSLNVNDSPGVGLTNNLPGSEWRSEGSFSGSANFVPAPGSIALLGLGGFLFRRRR